MFSVGRTGRGSEGAVQREKAHPFKSEWDHGGARKGEEGEKKEEELKKKRKKETGREEGESERAIKKER